MKRENWGTMDASCLYALHIVSVRPRPYTSDEKNTFTLKTGVSRPGGLDLYFKIATFFINYN